MQAQSQHNHMTGASLPSFLPSSSLPTPPAHLLSMMMNMITGGGPRPPSLPSSIPSSSPTSSISINTAVTETGSSKSVHPFMMLPSGPRPPFSLGVGGASGNSGGTSGGDNASKAVIDPQESPSEAAIESAVQAASLISASLSGGAGLSSLSTTSSSTSSSSSSFLNSNAISSSEIISQPSSLAPPPPSWASSSPPPIPQGSKLIWSDELLSPEEARAKIPRFAFDAKAFELDVEARLRAVLGEE